MKRKRLAIICSYKESCGNASYAHVLKMRYSEQVDCDVIPLDLFLLQKTSPRFAVAGDRHIKTIAAQLKDYDFVNIQFEAALYGGHNRHIVRRFKWLLDACRNVVVTMHRIDPPTVHIGRTMGLFWQTLMAGHPLDALFRLQDEALRKRNAERLYETIIDICRQRSKVANVWIGVHTKREKRMVEEIYRFERVFDFPITFLTRDQRQEVLHNTDLAAFRRRHGIGADTKVVGAFGFISSYKAYETLIEALRLLPPDYHLYLFGGQHPGTVAESVLFDPYIKSLVELIGDKNKQVVDDLRRRLTPYVRSKTNAPPENAELVQELQAALLQSLQYDLGKRVHFIGELSDPLFIEALRACDAVVLPYLEVGQSMSGVIALAIECGANLYCSRNKSFGEVMRYYGEVFNSFDIGNYVELSQKIVLGENRYEAERNLALEKYNLQNNVVLHLEKLGFAGDPADQELAAPIPALV